MSRPIVFLCSAILLLISGCTSETVAPSLPASSSPAGPTSLAEQSLPTVTPAPLWQPTGKELAGNWLGVVTLPGRERPNTLRVRITEESGQLVALVIVEEQAGPAVARDVQINSNHGETASGRILVDFLVDQTETAPLHFRGELTDAGLQGTVGDGGFWLIKPFEIDDWSPYIGPYRFDGDRVVNISPTPGYGSARFLDEGMWFTDYSSGDYRALVPVAEDTFLVGPAIGLAMPATAVVRFLDQEDGLYTKLSWQPLNERLGPADNSLAANRLDFSVEEVAFESDGVTLAGSLTLPPGEGPFPAIVQVHGSGRTTRDMMQRQTHFLASEGFAVLAYDKRGVGESGGVYSESATESRLLLLAQDAAAGAAFLRAHPSVGDQAIGLYGGSQAGWIIPAAAASSEEIDFAVILSGPVVTVDQEGIFSRMTGDGAKALAQNDEEVAAALEPAAGRGFDPIPYIKKLKIPVLWLWGGRDLSVPVPASRDNLEAIITNDNKEQFEYVLFPNGNHGLLESESGKLDDFPYIKQTVPELHNTIRRWLDQNVGVDRYDGDNH